MKKKILFALLLIIALFSTTGCGVGFAFTGCNDFQGCYFGIEGTYELTSIYDDDYIYKGFDYYTSGIVLLKLKPNNEAIIFYNDIGYKYHWVQNQQTLKLTKSNGEKSYNVKVDGNTLHMQNVNITYDEYVTLMFTKQ